MLPQDAAWVVVGNRSLMRMIIAASVVLSCCCAALGQPPTGSGSSGAGRWLYVDGRAGSDSNVGSAASPFQTIERCAATAVNSSADDGSACRVLAGVYRGTVNVSSDLTLQGYGHVVRL